MIMSDKSMLASAIVIYIVLAKFYTRRKSSEVRWRDPALWRISTDLCATTLECLDFFRRGTLKGLRHLPR